MTLPAGPHRASSIDHDSSPAPDVQVPAGDRAPLRTRLIQDARQRGRVRSAAVLIVAMLIGITVGAGVGAGISAGFRKFVSERPAAAVATAWGVNQRTVEPLIPGTRPVQVKDAGDMARVCELSGWPPDPCANSGLSPRIDYGTPPRLQHIYRDHDDYLAVLSYVDAADQTTPRWVVISLTRQTRTSWYQRPDWYVHTFADVPLSTEPSKSQAHAILANSRRCDPVHSISGC